MPSVKLETILVLAKFQKLKNISGSIIPILKAYVGQNNAAVLLKAMTSENIKEFHAYLKTLTEEEGCMSTEEMEAAAKQAWKAHGVSAVYFMDLYHSDDENLVKAAKDIAVDTYSMYIYNVIHNNYNTYSQKYGDELYQCGVIGLLKAMETYDPKQGAFTTYSQFYIIHEMSAQLNFHKNNTTVYYSKIGQKIQAAKEELIKQGFEPSLRSLSIMTDLSTEIIKRELDIMENNNVEYIDSMEKKDIAGPYDSTPPAIVETAERNDSLKNSIAKLSPEQRNIVIGKHNNKTNAQIAKENNMTIGQVKTGYQKGIQALRKDENLREQYTDYITSAERELNAFTPSPIVSKKTFEQMIDNMIEIVNNSSTQTKNTEEDQNEETPSAT